MKIGAKGNQMCTIGAQEKFDKANNELVAQPSDRLGVVDTVAASAAVAEVVGEGGLEPPTSCSQSTRATRLRHSPRSLSVEPTEGPRRQGECESPLECSVNAC